MPTIRKFDRMLDTLLSTEAAGQSGNSLAVPLLRARSRLRAYTVAESVMNAAIQASIIGTATGRQVVFDAMRIEDLPLPMWLETLNPTTGPKNGFLVEAQGKDLWAISTCIETQTGYGIAARAFTLRRDEQGSIRVHLGPNFIGRGKEVRELANLIMAMLAIVSAPMLTNTADEKPPRRGMTLFRRIRMAEPWNDVDRDGIPKLGKATRPTYVADEMLDEVYVLEGRIWAGIYQFDTSEQRSATLRHMHQHRLGITRAMRFVLSPLTAQAAAEVAEGDHAGVDKARTLVVLPDFLTWIEWRDVSCGVPGQRWGVLLQAVDDQAAQTDVQGLLFALPADWTLNRQSVWRMPMLSFELRLKSIGLPLLEVSDRSPAMVESGALDSDRLGRFLLATLTFISQPRMGEQIDTGQHSARRAIDRARLSKQLEPQVAIKEVRLVIDLPNELEAVSTTEELLAHHNGGVAPGGMPWHRVRMFWRWRLGRLEVVRPHFRGSMENGVSRRVTLLLRPSESARSPNAVG